ncbi:Rap1a/Tai family immunity protein [Comamonas jiangduensis]|uniref:Rap1a/Tai family immunity protein n=1 Tax=Comamonas jiangduensis TaxID=1194168 RepID=UPI003BF92319
MDQKILFRYELDHNSQKVSFDPIREPVLYLAQKLELMSYFRILSSLEINILTSMKKILISTLFAICSASSYAQVTGNMLHELCSSTLPASNTSCSLYIRGVLDAGVAIESFHKIPPKEQLTCVPEGVSFGQAIDVAKNYLRDHPEKRHKRAMVLVIESIANFPLCE